MCEHQYRTWFYDILIREAPSAPRPQPFGTSFFDAVDCSHTPASRCQNGGFHEPQGNRNRPMTDVITIGVDLAKNVFRVQGVDAEGGVVFCRQLRRGQMLPVFKKQGPCLVGMEPGSPTFLTASPTTKSQSWMNSCRGVTFSIGRNRLCPTTQGRGRRTVT